MHLTLVTLCPECGTVQERGKSCTNCTYPIPRLDSPEEKAKRQGWVSVAKEKETEFNYCERCREFTCTCTETRHE